MSKRKTVGIWAGRILSLLLGLAFIGSGVMKLMGGKQLRKGIEHLELSESLMLPIGILEITCAAIFLFPPTAVLGAILLTGYLGGAILTHVRVGDGFIGPVVFGILIWVAIALRDDRLWKLIPIRRASASNVSPAAERAA
jgi:uncharacterized membrane protein YphA (DoxX/SURF4 family)